MHCLIWGVHIPNQGSAPGLAWSEEGLHWVSTAGWTSMQSKTHKAKYGGNSFLVLWVGLVWFMCFHILTSSNLHEIHHTK